MGILKARFTTLLQSMKTILITLALFLALAEALPLKPTLIDDIVPETTKSTLDDIMLETTSDMQDEHQDDDPASAHGMPSTGSGSHPWLGATHHFMSGAAAGMHNDMSGP